MIVISQLQSPSKMSLRKKKKRKKKKEIECVWIHETIIRTGIRCNKIFCCMCDSTCKGLIVGNAKIFQSYVKSFFNFPT